ncbi:bifunctional folylpolyglutamate synthase/dihydrofolate synthase [Leptolyngbya sp. 7M]|uniref:bifunctional folylpolyglutamate synthase/dihydrofolate synthase n=1 Tax=Leptolyngbya sp. 7M TaxID=2812896 RepID=UPI001B8B5E7A|nr:folylpolyglutamate synthase/dihydrofolate synthase family protein [Leptolyngbya sp. 7M]QYO62382.1 bifunctional folylpolyglutamate synthase/dihydrofolate synthase [Leptolyngbya sp. 7M]
MNFAEAESYLYSLGNEVEAIKLGLENIRALLAELGNPQEKYLKVQVAGTNGKGSVCVFLDSICRQADVKTGLYTSPHLISITERIKINGADIGEDDFASLATLVRKTSERLLAEGTLTYTPTFFEQVTAIALVAFAKAGVELAILETGLGGRLDATTAANAEIAAITHIDFDHQEHLGDTIEEIADEKAAIIRADTQAVIIGRQSPNALEVIWDRLRRLQYHPRNIMECAVIFDESALGNPVRMLPSEIGLLGAHQIENAEVAIMLAYGLRGHFYIADDQIRLGLRNARHPGRLEYIGNLLLDGAHNVSGAKALLHFLTYVEKRPLTMIFGAMRDKNVGEIAGILWPRAERLILTQPSNSRALTAEELSEFLPENIDPKKVVLTVSVEEALAVASSDEFVVVTGSLYLVGEVKNLLNN